MHCLGVSSRDIYVEYPSGILDHNLYVLTRRQFGWYNHHFFFCYNWVRPTHTILMRLRRKILYWMALRCSQCHAHQLFGWLLLHIRVWNIYTHGNLSKHELMMMRRHITLHDNHKHTTPHNLKHLFGKAINPDYRLGIKGNFVCVCALQRLCIRYIIY